VAVLRTAGQLVSQAVAGPRFRSWLISLFAGLALLLAWTLPGVAVGLGLGMASTRWIAAFLFGIGPWDAPTLAATAVVPLLWQPCWPRGRLRGGPCASIRWPPCAPNEGRRLC
jgi:hypothetical protein